MPSLDLTPISLAFDRRFLENFDLVVGVDEVGRGSLAGPVASGAVCLDLSIQELHGVRDSKELTPEQRKLAVPRIKQASRAYGYGEATADEINVKGITDSTGLSMTRALEQALALLPASRVLILIDGDRVFDSFQKLPSAFRQHKLDFKTIVKGDSKSLSIGAASVLAKVTRDGHMEALDEKYPGYGFDRHKGYGTSQHIQALGKLGLCPEHRTKFVKKHWLNPVPAPDVYPF